MNALDTPYESLSIDWPCPLIPGQKIRGEFQWADIPELLRSLDKAFEGEGALRPDQFVLANWTIGSCEALSHVFADMAVWGLERVRDRNSPDQEVPRFAIINGGLSNKGEFVDSDQPTPES